MPTTSPTLPGCRPPPWPIPRRKAGPARAILALGQGWVVRSHAIEYLLPAFAGDHLAVETWVATMKKVTSLRRYRIVRRGDAAVLATAETNWAFVDLAGGRPVRIPPEVAGAFVVVER